MIFAVILQILPVVIVIERKLLGRFQMRYGPNRVGPFGFMQPLAEIVKFARKENTRPHTAIPFLYILAPVISILTAVAALAIIPFGDTVDIFGTEVGLYGIDVSIGVLYVFAFGAIAFYALMLGGLGVAARSTRSSARCAPPRSSSRTRSRRAWRSSASS